MSINTTVPVSVSTITVNSSVLETQTFTYSNTYNILNCINVITALVGVTLCCFVANIVRKLDDNDLRSRFSLLSILICDVILALCDLPISIYELTLIDQKRFDHLKCPLDNVSSTGTSLFIMPLVLSLMCLALDQVIAVFKPLYFRTSEGTRRRIIYGAITCIPVPLASIMLIYFSLEITKSSYYTESYCESFTKAVSELLSYQFVIAVPLAVSTPVIYAVVLWKISGQSSVHSDNPVESIENRRLVMSFLFLSASYVLLWIPTLAYFIFCHYSSNGCWEEETTDTSLVLFIIFTFNFIIDPVTCAVRMEPIKQRIILMFRFR
ncbi:uncharacterized protein LOC121384404 [Gigantopelta aegis]|uniref:uncharacterized protein LOC121384404 n=1 Tax=Gigantopelta aegis TaxID=1735272 RepID=UPI001B88DC7E|nr:uncharacterized protein LOC121384404 [Gigantopelta aegis]